MPDLSQLEWESLSNQSRKVHFKFSFRCHLLLLLDDGYGVIQIERSISVSALDFTAAEETPALPLVLPFPYLQLLLC